MVLEGKSVFGGIAIGKLSVYGKKDRQVKRIKISDTEAEAERFHSAREKAKEQLTVLYEKALKEVGEVNAMIFEVHKMMLDDLDYIESVTNMIRSQEVNAEFAAATTGDNFAGMFSAMEDSTCGNGRRMYGISATGSSLFCRGRRKEKSWAANRRSC